MQAAKAACTTPFPIFLLPWENADHGFRLLEKPMRNLITVQSILEKAYSVLFAAYSYETIKFD